MVAKPAAALGQTDDLQTQAQDLDSSYQQALTDLVAVDSEVNRYNNEIAANNERQAAIQASMAQEHQRLDELQGQLDERQMVLAKRLRNTYKSDDTGYLEVVMGADDFSDFINRLDMMNIIADGDRQLIDSIKDSRQTLEDELAKLAEQQDQLTKMTDDLTAARQKLVDAQAEQQSTVDSLKNQRDLTADQLAQLQSQAAQIEANMSQLQSEAANGSGYEDDGDYGSSPASGASFTVTATAYCLQGTTATGMPAGHGIIAVDPSVIPLGSRVHVSGYGDAIAADTGGAIIGNKIDVWLPCGEAYAWGVRTVTVTIY